MQDLATKITGGNLPATEWNEAAAEIQKAITGTGQTLSALDLSQLAKGIAQYSTDGNFLAASGTVDAVILSKSGLTDKQAPQVQTEGQALRFIATGDNTGAMTVSPYGTATVPLKDRFDNALPAGSVLTGQEVTIIRRQALDGGAGGYELKVVEVPFSQGYLYGVKLENDTGGDVDHDLIFNTGKGRDDPDSINMVLGSALTKQIDANFVAGTGAGGFPNSLTLLADTTYHCFLISKPDGTVDAGFDTSLTAVNLLAAATGYTSYRRVGYVITDGSLNMIPTKWIGDKCIYPVTISDFFTSSEGTTRTTRALSRIPLGKKFTVGVIAYTVYNSATPQNIIWTDLDDTDVVPTVSNSQLTAETDDPARTATRKQVFEITSDTSSQIGTRASATTVDHSGTVQYIIDTRGKE